MATWKDLLATADVEGALARAMSALGRKTVYELGKGGGDPTKPLGKKCDCSGFIAWAIGIPRELPPGSGAWLDTDAYWNGGPRAALKDGHTLFVKVSRADVQVGDIIVYPDYKDAGGGHREGHMGIVSQVDDDGLRVIHCSSSASKKYGDAVQETSPSVFDVNPKTRVVRIDYTALRAYCGVAAAVPLTS